MFFEHLADLGVGGEVGAAVASHLGRRKFAIFSEIVSAASDFLDDCGFGGAWFELFVGDGVVGKFVTHVEAFLDDGAGGVVRGGEPCHWNGAAV